MQARASGAEEMIGIKRTTLLAMVSLLLVIGAALSIWPRHLSLFPESQTAAPEHDTNLTVHGQVFRIKTPGQVTTKDILVAAGPQGFYWSLLQNPGETGMPDISVALGDAPQSLNQFQGTVYLPAAVNPSPFYQVETAADASHYEVDFDAQEHPVPLNATDRERRELGGDPSCAGLLGSVAGYGGGCPQAAKMRKFYLRASCSIFTRENVS